MIGRHATVDLHLLLMQHRIAISTGRGGVHFRFRERDSQPE